MLVVRWHLCFVPRVRKRRLLQQHALIFMAEDHGPVCYNRSGFNKDLFRLAGFVAMWLCRHAYNQTAHSGPSELPNALMSLSHACRCAADAWSMRMVPYDAEMAKIYLGSFGGLILAFTCSSQGTSASAGLVLAAACVTGPVHPPPGSSVMQSSCPSLLRLAAYTKGRQLHVVPKAIRADQDVVLHTGASALSSQLASFVMNALQDMRLTDSGPALHHPAGHTRQTPTWQEFQSCSTDVHVQGASSECCYMVTIRDRRADTLYMAFVTC